MPNTLILYLLSYKGVVNVDNSKLPFDRSWNDVYDTLECSGGVPLIEQHICELIKSMLRGERCHSLVKFFCCCYIANSYLLFASTFDNTSASSKFSINSPIREMITNG